MACGDREGNKEEGKGREGRGDGVVVVWEGGGGRGGLHTIRISLIICMDLL